MGSLSFLFAARVFAAEKEGDPFQYELMVPIPQPEGREPVATVTGERGPEGPGYVRGISGYINILYLFGLGIGGILAFGALVYGGFLWTVSGAIDKKSHAKSIMGNALLGIALLATSYIILHTVNPDLVGPQFDPSAVEETGIYSDPIPPDPNESLEKACHGITNSQDCSQYSEQAMKVAGYAQNGDQEMRDLWLHWVQACEENKCDICSTDKKPDPESPEEGKNVCVWEPQVSGPLAFYAGRCVSNLGPEGCSAEEDSASPVESGEENGSGTEECEDGKERDLVGTCKKEVCKNGQWEQIDDGKKKGESCESDSCGEPTGCCICRYLKDPNDLSSELRCLHCESNERCCDADEGDHGGCVNCTEKEKNCGGGDCEIGEKPTGWECGGDDEGCVVTGCEDDSSCTSECRPGHAQEDCPESVEELKDDCLKWACVDGNENGKKDTCERRVDEEKIGTTCRPEFADFCTMGKCNEDLGCVEAGERDCSNASLSYRSCGSGKGKENCYEYEDDEEEVTYCASPNPCTDDFCVGDNEKFAGSFRCCAHELICDGTTCSEGSDAYNEWCDD